MLGLLIFRSWELRATRATDEGGVARNHSAPKTVRDAAKGNKPSPATGPGDEVADEWSSDPEDPDVVAAERRRRCTALLKEGKPNPYTHGKLRARQGGSRDRGQARRVSRPAGIRTQRVATVS